MLYMVERESMCNAIGLATDLLENMSLVLQPEPKRKAELQKPVVKRKARKTAADERLVSSRDLGGQKRRRTNIRCKGDREAEHEKAAYLSR